MDILLYIMILICIVGYELARKKRGRFDLLSLINLQFILGYILIPLWFIFASVPGALITYSWYSRLLISPVYVTIAYLCLLTGWLAIGKRYILKPNVVIYKESKVKTYLFLATAFSLLMLYIYAQAFGGFSDALTLGSLYRFSTAVAKEKIIVSGSAIALYFVGFAKIVFLYSFFRIIGNSNRNKRFYVFMLIAGGMIIFTYSIINGGRGSIFGIIVVSFLIILLMKKKFPVGKTLVVFLLMIGIIGFGKSLIRIGTYYVKTGIVKYSMLEGRDFKNIFGMISNEGAHAILSLEKALETVGHDIDYTYMAHFPEAALHLLPSKLLNLTFVKPETISYINSINVMGYYYGMPPALIASLYYGLGLVGIICGMFLFGVIAKILQNTLYKWMDYYAGMLPLAVLIFYNYSSFVLSGDLVVALKHNFYLFIALGFLIISVRLKRYRLRGRTYLMVTHPTTTS
jgi:hypothetical protein